MPAEGTALSVKDLSSPITPCKSAISVVPRYTFKPVNFSSALPLLSVEGLVQLKVTLMAPASPTVAVRLLTCAGTGAILLITNF